MNFRAFKGKFLQAINDVKDEELDPTLSKDEVHKLYLKIIRQIHTRLKDIGFNKHGNVTLYRIQNEICHLLNFQKSTYGARMTINTSIRPIYFYMTDAILLSCKRIGELDKGFDKWYPINHNYLELAEYLFDVIMEKVIPRFQLAFSSSTVLK